MREESQKLKNERVVVIINQSVWLMLTFYPSVWLGDQLYIFYIKCYNTRHLHHYHH